MMGKEEALKYIIGVVFATVGLGEGNSRAIKYGICSLTGCNYSGRLTFLVTHRRWTPMLRTRTGLVLLWAGDNADG